MRKNPMYFNVNRTKICRKHYRPSTGILSLIKSIFTVIVVGESPIGHHAAKRRVH